MKITIFLGAGASVPFGKPTTKELKENLLKKYEHKSPYPFLRYLLEYKDHEDIEHILQTIKDIQFFKNSFGGNFFNQPSFQIYFHILGSQIPYQTFVNELNPIQELLENEVFQNYSWKHKTNVDDDQALRDMFLPIFDRLRKSSEKLNVFTTNYDQAIEEFCSLNNEFRCVDGFKFDPDSRRLLWNKGDYTYFDKNTDSVNVYLYKLHGSLNWKLHRKYGPERTTFESKPTDEKYEEDFLIYPTLSPKDGAKKEPYKTIRKHFSQEMSKSDGCIVIGFSFRDQHLNEIFTEFVKNGKALIVISPSSVENVCKNLLDEPIPEYDKNRINTFPSKNYSRISCIPQPISKTNVKTLIDLSVNLVDGLLKKPT
ncbi:MAG: SIR2 family protein [Candidatus Nitrosotenuis sp.]